jgi:hypothetical protein
MWKAMLKGVKGLIQSNGKESSKRAIALFFSIVIAILMAIWTSPENFLYVLDATFVFILTLLGIAVYQAVKKDTKAPKDPKEPK